MPQQPRDLAVQRDCAHISIPRVPATSLLRAAIPTIVLIQLGGAGVGVVNLVVGGLLYLGVYLTLAPILGARYQALS